MLALTLSTLCYSSYAWNARDAFVPPYYLDVRWYGTEAPSKVTANGEPWDPQGLTFASRSAIIGTVVKVEWKGRSITVRCNDRGPNVVELTKGAFERLDDPRVGVLRNAKVTIINK